MKISPGIIARLHHIDRRLMVLRKEHCAYLSDSCESRNNHRYAVVVQDKATQWIQSYPCKTKTSQETQRTCKSCWSRIGIRKSFTLTFPWKLAKPLKIFPGIIVRQHHTDREKWDCRKSSAQSETRDMCGIVAIRSGQRMVGGFYGMLLLSAKHSRSLV